MTMANNKEKKVLNVPNSTDRRNVIRNVPHLRFPEFEGEWQKHKLCNIASIVGRIGFRGYTTNDIVAKGKGAIALSPTNIENNRLTYDKDNTYISFYKFEESPEIMIKQGDVVFVKTGSTVGKVAYVDKLMCKTTLNPQLVVLKNIQCDNYLLSVLMSTSRFQNAIRKITVGGAVPTLSQAAMGDIAVTMPQVAEQEKLSKFISLLDKRIATQNKIIERYESLIRGIRNGIFGKLRKSIGFNAIVGNVLQYEQPQSYIVEDTEYTKDGTPVLTANKAFVLGYTSEVAGIYDKGNCIIFDDFTLDCKYVDFPFKVKSSAIKILTAQSNELLRYTFEFLKYLDLSTEEHKRHYIAETQNQGFILPSTKTVEMVSHTFSVLSLRLSSTVQLKNKYEAQKRYLLRQMFI